MHTIQSQHYVYGGTHTGGLIAAEKKDFYLANPQTFETKVKVQIKDTSAVDLFQIIKNIHPSQPEKTFNEGGIQLFRYHNILITVSIDGGYKYFEKQKITASVLLTGDLQAVEIVYNQLKKYTPKPSANVDWYFMSGGDVTNVTVQLRHQEPPKDEFYPWIPGGIKKFYSDFLESEASVLLFLGDAGTGKTSLIRDLIHEHELSTAITHDEDLMQSDAFFITFMTSDDRLLVLEDSDILLHRREDGNSAMSKLLNTSDGLIRTDKKIILSANLTDVNSVDSALIRPGRCFAIIRFRPLSVAESAIAAKVIGVEAPSKPSTIAELFNGRAETLQGPTFGFHHAKRNG